MPFHARIQPAQQHIAMKRAAFCARLARMKQLQNIILASGSPRRRELMAQEGLAFEVHPANAEEIIPAGLTPAETAQHLATIKAQAVVTELATDGVVIGADTIVVLGDVIYGKPTDASDAHRILRELSGNTHQVMTGVCVFVQGVPHAFVEITDVTFHNLTDAEIDAYIATGEPMDKAGAYGIQGEGGALVAGTSGDYDNVVGLPVRALVAKLESLGIIA